MSKRKIVIIALFCFSCYSKPNGSNYFEPPVLKKIVRLSSIQPPPPVISFAPVYVIGINDSVSESSFAKLQEVYNALYKNKYPAFDDFLFDALNQKIKIDSKNSKTYFYYSQTFSIDPGISYPYKKKGINGIIEKYCIYRSDFYTLRRETLTLNEVNSISYYFFINQLARFDDDYNATINFKKLISFLN